MKRKMLIVIAALLVMTMLVPVAASAYTLYVKTGNGGPVNVREAASTNSKVLAKLVYGTQVEAVSNEGIWTVIDVPGTDTLAYVMSKYLSNTDPGKSPATDDPAEATIEDLNFKSFKLVVPCDAYVKASHPGGFVNLRWAPSLAAPVQKRMNDGAQLEVIAEGKGWRQVRDAESGFTGFMKAEFMTKVDGAVGAEQ